MFLGLSPCGGQEEDVVQVNENPEPLLPPNGAQHLHDLHESVWQSADPKAGALELPKLLSH